MKEAKISKELKKQLQQKLAIIKEKNKVLMDHQRKANEGEKRLLELQQKVSKFFELETRLKELEEMVAFRDDTVAAWDKALLVYQRDAERLKVVAARAVEGYKFSDAFQEEVTEASGETFNCTFKTARVWLENSFMS
ncbi:hypothetical protein COCNU_10G010160 [Cocos nucifera]|uniref:Uncharacterized protein n=1 Tax=Cocos nucifera TaxID=13894 RepID=A0A8K0ING4_COCNU|nr:hypothetical protein COCNU_10G010160 [Cocos nucifera]